MHINKLSLSTIHFILHHTDADGGLAALALRRAVQRETGRVLPLCWADYHSNAANSLHEIAVMNPNLYTVDVRLFPGVRGMDHHDTSETWFDPEIHILDLSAPSCFSLMLDIVGQREEWPENIVQHVDWMDSGTYPSAELAVGLDQPGQHFLNIFTRLEFEHAMAELWQNPDAEAFIRRHQDMLEQARSSNELIRQDMQRGGRVQGKVAIWDSSDIIQRQGIRQSAINPFLLTAVFSDADYTIRIRPNGHMTVGHNPWAKPTAHIGQLCETLEDPATGISGGGKAQVGGAPATAETIRRAIEVLNSDQP